MAGDALGDLQQQMRYHGSRLLCCGGLGPQRWNYYWHLLAMMTILWNYSYLSFQCQCSVLGIINHDYTILIG